MESTRDDISYKNITWVDIANPTAEDVAALAKKYRFHELDAEDCLNETQRPKIDEYDRYLFIVLHFPVYNRATKRIRTAELDLFIGQNFIITLHDGDLEPIKNIRENCKRIAGKRALFGRGTGYFLYELTSTLFDSCFPLLDSLWRKANRLEQAVWESDAAQDLLKEIMILKRNIITFRRILSPERQVVAALEHKNKKFLPEDLEVYFDDVVDKTEKLWGSLASLKEVSESIQDTNENLISHRTGNTIKILTIFSVILLPLTLISGLFGMNVPIPHANEPIAFWLIAAGMLAVVGIMVAFFQWKRWL